MKSNNEPETGNQKPETLVLDTILQDLRYRLRMLKKRPGITAIAVITLALGISANTAIFSVAYAAILRPLPFALQEQLFE